MHRLCMAPLAEEAVAEDAVVARPELGPEPAVLAMAIPLLLLLPIMTLLLGDGGSVLTVGLEKGVFLEGGGGGGRSDG